MSDSRSVSANAMRSLSWPVAALTITSLAGGGAIIQLDRLAALQSPTPQRFLSEQWEHQVSKPMALAGNLQYSSLSRSLSESLQAQRAYLVALPLNWDGYGAEAIQLHVLDRLYADLEDALARIDSQAPDIIPGADGSVQAEWHLNDIELSYNVSVNGDRYFAVSTPAVDGLEFFGADALPAFRKWAPFLAKKVAELPLVA